MKRGSLTILQAPPGFEAQRSAAKRLLTKRGVSITSSRHEALRHLRDWVFNNDEFLARYQTGDASIELVGELVGRLASHAALPHRRSAPALFQEALIAGCAEEIERLTAFGEAAYLPGFHAAAVQTLQELRHHRVSPGELPAREQRARDLACLIDIMDRELERHRLSTLSHRIDRLVDAEPSLPEGLRHILWIGEDEWPPIFVALVDWLTRAGCKVTVLTEEHPFDDQFFVASSVLKEAFPDAQVMRQETPTSPVHALFAPVQSHEKGDAGVRIVAAADEFVEVEHAVRHVRDRLRQGIAHWDLVLFAPSLDEYGPLLHSACVRLGVPIEVDYRAPLLTSPFARFCLGALSAAGNGSLHAVAGLCDSPYSAVPAESRAEVKRAVQSLAAANDPWEALRSGAIAGLPDWLADYATWRASAASGQRTLSDWISAFRDLLARTPWLDEGASSALHRRNEAALDAMLRSLEAEAVALAGRTMPLREFVRRARSRWQATDYTIRIRDRQGVRVTQSAWDVGPAREVVALAMTEGRVPKKRTEDPLLPDSLRKLVRSALLPDSYAVAERSRREFYRLVTSAKDVTLYYPVTFGESDEVQSVFIADLQRLLGGVQVRSVGFEKRFPLPSEEDDLFEQVACAAWHGVKPPTSEAEQLLDALADEVRRCDSPTIISPSLQEEVSRIPQPLRLSHIRAAELCSFQFLTLAHLRLRNERQHAIWRMAARTIRNTDLLDDAESLRERLHAQFQTELDAQRAVTSESELRVLELAVPTVLDLYCEVERAAREKWKLRPIRQNVRLSETELRDTIPHRGTQIKLDDTIDVLYERDGKQVPLRFGFVPDKHEQLQDFELRASLIAVLQPKGMRAVLFHDITGGERMVLYQRERPNENLFPSSVKDNLRSHTAGRDGERLNIVEFLNETAARMREALDKMSRGVVHPEPGFHCERCGFEDLCRRHDIKPEGWGGAP
jgi:hypothetical protein